MTILYTVDQEAKSINVVEIAEGRYDMLLKPITHSPMYDMYFSGLRHFGQEVDF